MDPTAAAFRYTRNSVSTAGESSDYRPCNHTTEKSGTATINEFDDAPWRRAVVRRSEEGWRSRGKSGIHGTPPQQKYGWSKTYVEGLQSTPEYRGAGGCQHQPGSSRGVTAAGYLEDSTELQPA